MPRGINWIGVELEEKFVKLGRKNLALWDGRYRGKMPRWGQATLLQGDSRELAQILGEAGLAGVVSSPPYATQRNVAGDQAASPGLKWHNVTPSSSRTGAPPNEKWYYGQDYGTHPGQLGNMPEGSIDMALSSPPYASGVINTSSPTDSDRQHRLSIGRDPDSAGSHGVRTGYGQAPGQLAAMPSGNFQAVVSSPPWESCLSKDGRSSGANDHKIIRQLEEKYNRRYTDRSFGPDTYGESTGQLGQESGNTFWQAARAILEQTYQVLAPGAHAIWVVKSFVRKKKLVDFPGQWRQLCESVGFETLHQHRAWLVEDRGSQYGLDGGQNESLVERKSFFRRLAESKARAAKLWPMVARLDKARHLWAAHNMLWHEYKSKMIEYSAGELEMRPPYPTRTRITGSAQMRAFTEAGKPRLDIDTAIDYEVVLCMIKPNPTVTAPPAPFAVTP